MKLGQGFFNTYLRPLASPLILEVGSQNVNGGLRDVAPAGSSYVGVDICEGQGVDIVLDDPYSYPFKNNHFDAVVSTSCFEHDEMFWLTFLEMIRVTKKRGLIYINAPSNGSYHRYPVDNWRFYPDAGRALVRWSERQGKRIELVKSSVARRKAEYWNDYVMIFRVGKPGAAPSGEKLSDLFPQSYNLRIGSSDEIVNLEEWPEDVLMFRSAKHELAIASNELNDTRNAMAAMQHELSETHHRLAVQSEEAAAVDAELSAVEEMLANAGAVDELSSPLSPDYPQAGLARSMARLTTIKEQLSATVSVLSPLRASVEALNNCARQIDARFDRLDQEPATREAQRQEEVLREIAGLRRELAQMAEKSARDMAALAGRIEHTNADLASTRGTMDRSFQACSDEFDKINRRLASRQFKRRMRRIFSRLFSFAARGP